MWTGISLEIILGELRSKSVKTYPSHTVLSSQSCFGLCARPPVSLFTTLTARSPLVRSVPSSHSHQSTTWSSTVAWKCTSDHSTSHFAAVTTWWEVALCFLTIKDRLYQEADIELIVFIPPKKDLKYRYLSKMFRFLPSEALNLPLFRAVLLSSRAILTPPGLALILRPREGRCRRWPSWHLHDSSPRRSENVGGGLPLGLHFGSKRDRISQ